MKEPLFPKTIVILFLTSCILQGCVTTYKPMHIEKIPMDTQHRIEGTEIQVAIKYDLLTIPGTRQYAKMEKKSKVSLVEVAIQNSGQQDLYVDRDLVFLTSAGDTIVPLAMEQAAESLVKPVTDEENTAFVQVSPPSGWISDLGKAVNDSKKVVSHVRFANDIFNHYLEGRVVAPGAYEQGLLVFPVIKGTRLQAALR